MIAQKECGTKAVVPDDARLAQRASQFGMLPGAHLGIIAGA